MIRPMGRVTGEGLGVVYIKAYDQAVKDGDFIHAVIKGSAVNSDGRSSGITAPNAIAQSETVRMAWKRANNPEKSRMSISRHTERGPG